MNPEFESLPTSTFVLGESGFPAPDWEQICEWVESNFSENRHDEAWREVARIWVRSISECLGDSYQSYEASDFLLLTKSSPDKASELLSFVQSTDQAIRETIPELLPESLYGLCPILVFHSDHDFYRYVSGYFAEAGHFGGMGGIFINRGYGHFAMQSIDLARYVDVVSHELCHAYLTHLALPLWLDEAITGGVEHSITGNNPYVLDREMIARHQSFWTPKNIGEFWSGESFYRPDDGQELSYHLARFILHALHSGGQTSKSDLTSFYLSAKWIDAGASAAKETLGISLGDCLIGLLGDVDWEPKADAATE